MENRGMLVAADTNERRLSRGRQRLRRAGAENYHKVTLTGEANDPFFAQHKDHFDRALVDVPCSGTGAWGVNPENKWKHDYGQVLERLVVLQAEILANTAKLVKPGGRLVYATCSLLDVENDGAVARFLKQFGHFEVVPAQSVWEKVLPGVAWPCAQPEYLKLLPSHHTGGFFAAVLERKA
jgi:16S rRNA (cytosine967-C5)-methyltransferase